jgi:hypothetical protein
MRCKRCGDADAGVMHQENVEEGIIEWNPLAF